jgi:hypothetical protein
MQSQSFELCRRRPWIVHHPSNRLGHRVGDNVALALSRGVVARVWDQRREGQRRELHKGGFLNVSSHVSNARLPLRLPCQVRESNHDPGKWPR